MRKKLMIACVAIASFSAFAAPSVASASILTENGLAVAVGSSIKGTATEPRFTVGAITLTCSRAQISGTLTGNSNGTVAAEIPAGNFSAAGTAAGEDCTTSSLGPFKWTMNSKLCLHVAKGTDTGTITGCGVNVTFTLNFTNSGALCRYETASVSMAITTSPNDAALSIVENLFKGETGNSFICPTEFRLDMEFTLTTTDGSTLLFS